MTTRSVASASGLRRYLPTPKHRTSGHRRSLSRLIDLVLPSPLDQARLEIVRGSSFHSITRRSRLRESRRTPSNGRSLCASRHANRDLLPSGFPFDPGWKWIAGIGFEQQLAARSGAELLRRELARGLGFDDDETLDRASALLRFLLRNNVAFSRTGRHNLNYPTMSPPIQRDVPRKWLHKPPMHPSARQRNARDQFRSTGMRSNRKPDSISDSSTPPTMGR